MLRTVKRAFRRVIEAQGYFVRPTSAFGFSLDDDLRRLLRREHPVIFDVGANSGQWVSSITKTFPGAQLHCYEPDERAFAELVRAADGLPGVSCVPYALGVSAGQLTFFRNADSVTSSLLRPAAQEQPLPYAEKLKPLDSVTVEVRTLSDELRRLQIAHVDLLKTDCQGFDLRVLEGVAGPLEAGAIDLVLTEALFHLEYDGQAWFHEILAWMSARHFSLIGIYDILHDDSGRALFGDALFARSS